MRASLVSLMIILDYCMDIVSRGIFFSCAGAVRFNLGFSATYCSFSFCSHSTVTFHAHLSHLATPSTTIHFIFTPLHITQSAIPCCCDIYPPLLIHLSCTYRYTAENSHFALIHNLRDLQESSTPRASNNCTSLDLFAYVRGIREHLKFG
jgi:hypothetical protein